VAELISMPKMGFDMAEGLLQEWLKKVGDAVAEGETIAIVETDKASVEVPAFRSGVLLKIVAEAGTSVPIGAPIAVIGSAGETVDMAALGLAEATPAPAVASVPEAAAAGPATEPIAETGSTEEGRLLASPIAARMAAELGIDLRQVTGSGPGGRIIKRDIEAHLKEREKAPVRAAPAPMATPRSSRCLKATPLSCFHRCARPLRMVESSRRPLTSPEADMAAARTACFRNAILPEEARFLSTT
jgi:pyruvate dehydrogenase E2 component (dihydrolipoamide acetyltransferase)